jgi:hypothetical protein
MVGRRSNELPLWWRCVRRNLFCRLSIDRISPIVYHLLPMGRFVIRDSCSESSSPMGKLMEVSADTLEALEVSNARGMAEA